MIPTRTTGATAIDLMSPQYQPCSEAQSGKRTGPSHSPCWGQLHWTGGAATQLRPEADKRAARPSGSGMVRKAPLRSKYHRRGGNVSPDPRMALRLGADAGRSHRTGAAAQLIEKQRKRGAVVDCCAVGARLLRRPHVSAPINPEPEKLPPADFRKLLA